MYAVIMAGGIGTRFWPRSREEHPKQLLRILGNRTLIQSTVDRLTSLIDLKDIFIVTTHKYQHMIHEQLPNISGKNFINEPKGRNTAPCIGLAALFIERMNPDAVMAVLPADHHIKNEKQFLQILAAAEKVAASVDCLVTIGIQPTFPSTGYGYIQFNDLMQKIDKIPYYNVKTFAEKPDSNTAIRFLESGDFLWNSGMFIWKTKTILKEIEQSLPELYDGLMEIKKSLGTNKQDEVIHKVYCQIKSISIDYGVMEDATKVCVLKGDFGWSDVGSWDEVFKITQKGEHGIVSIGDHFSYQCQNCLIDVPDKFVATVGVDDLIIVDTEDALLVCHRDRAQDVKELVENMKKKNLTQYL